MAIDLKFLDKFMGRDDTFSPYIKPKNNKVSKRPKVDTSFLDQFEEDEEDEEEEKVDISFLDKFAKDPIEDYNTSISLTGKFKDSYQNNFSKYQEIYQKPEKTPEEKEEMVSAWQKSHNAKLALYDEQEKLAALIPEVNKIVKKQEREEIASIEKLGNDPNLATVVPELLERRDIRNLIESEINEAISDPVERDNALKSNREDYVSRIKSTIETVNTKASERDKKLNDVAGVLKYSDEEMQKERERRGIAAGRGGVAPMFVPEVTQTAMEEKVESALADIPEEERDQYKQEARTILNLSNGSSPYGIVNNRLQVAPNILFNEKAVKQAVEEAPASEVQKKAFMDSLPDLREKVASAQMPVLSEYDKFQEFVEENNLQDASNVEKVKAFNEKDISWLGKANEQVQLGAAQAYQDTIGQIQSAVGAGLYAYEKVGLATDPKKVSDLAQAFAAAAGDQQQKIEDLQLLSDTVGGPKILADITNTGLQMAPILFPSFGVGLAARGFGLTAKTASNLGFATAVAASGAQSFSSTYGRATEAVKDRLIEESINFAERELIDQGIAPEEARERAQSRAMNEDKARDIAMRQAYLPSVISGLSTATVTALGGKFGPESITRKEILGLARNEGYKQAVKGFVRDVSLNAAVEAPEELVDQFIQGVTEKLTYNPEKTMEDIIGESLYAGAMGAGFGGAFGAVTYVATKKSNRLAQEAIDKDADLAAKQELLDEVNRITTELESVAPESADAAKILAEETQAKLNREAVEKGLVEPKGEVISIPATVTPRVEGETDQEYRARIEAERAETPDQRVARLQREAQEGAGDIELEEEVSVSGLPPVEPIPPVTPTPEAAVAPVEPVVPEVVVEPPEGVGIVPPPPRQKFTDLINEGETSDNAYQRYQSQIDEIEDRLEAEGVDIVKLVDPTLAGARNLIGQEGYVEMPPDLVEAYARREAVGAGQLAQSVGELTEVLKNQNISEQDIKRVLDTYAIDVGKVDAFAQYKANEYTKAKVDAPPITQLERVAIALAAERGEMFDAVEDISKETLLDAGRSVKAIQDYFGVRPTEQQRNEFSRVSGVEFAALPPVPEVVEVEPTPVTPAPVTPVTPNLEPLRRVARAEQTEEDVSGLVGQGLVELYNRQPVITQAGLETLPETERPRLTPEARKIQIDTRTSEPIAEAISKNLRIGVDQVPFDVRMPAGWTIEGDIYVPPVVEAAPEAVAPSVLPQIPESAPQELQDYQIRLKSQSSQIPTPDYGTTPEQKTQALDTVRQRIVQKYQNQLSKLGFVVEFVDAAEVDANGNGIDSSVSISPTDGRIVLTFGNQEMRNFARSEASESDTKAAIAQVIDEEIIHAVHLKNLATEWDGTGSLFDFLNRRAGEKFGQAFNELGRDRFIKAFGSMLRGYYRSDLTNEQILQYMATQPQLVLANYSEIVRQLTEMQTRGEISESLSNKILNYVVEFFQEILNSINALTASPEYQRSALKQEVDAVASAFQAVIAQPKPEPTRFTEESPEASNAENDVIVTQRAEAKKAQELVTGHSVLLDEVPAELREEAQAGYQNGMALGDFLNPEFFNLGEAYQPYIAATWLELNGGLMPTVKVEGKEIAKPEKGTSEAEALRLLRRASDILDSRSETTGGKELTYSLKDIMATWIESGLGPAALKNAIVQFTNLDVAQADKTANDFANVYQLAQNVTSTKERARVRMDRALPASTNRQQREKERMIKLEEAAGSIDSIAEAIRIAYDIGVKKPKTDKATEKKQIEEQLRQAKQILRDVVPKQYLGDQLTTLQGATGIEGLKKVVEAAQNGLNQARLDEAVAGAKKSLDRAQKVVKANEISPEAMAVLRDFVETYSKKGIGPETRAKIEDAISRYEADPVGALQDLATDKYLKQKGVLGAIKIDKSLGLDALKEISRIINTTLHADKVARGEMLFNKQETRQEVIAGISEEIDKVKSIAKARKDGGQGIGLFNKIALYKGARVENILRAFGLNKLSEFVYDRLTLDAYQDELRVRRDLKKKIESRIKDITGLEVGTKDYDLYSKEVVELTGVDSAGRTKPIKIRRYELLDILASLRDPSNLKRAVNSGGYVIDRLDLAEVDTVKITPETYIEILNKATDQDNQMVDMMVELYNNDLFQILENASVQAYGHGIKAVSGTYYPRTADKWTRATEVKKDLDYIAYYQRRVDDVGYLKERDERSKSKLRAVDFLERLDYHVTNDARIGAYLPIVRDIEMVLGDPAIARPLASKIGEEGLNMIREMVRQQTTPPAGIPAGLLSTLVGNAGVGVLGFKLHAAMQNPVGIPIAVAYYGKDGFKYLAQAFPAGIKATKKSDRIEMANVLSKYAPYYNERYGDGGFIQEFTSGLSNAPSNRKWRKNLETAAMSWLEGTDRWGALVRYKLAQQVIQDRTTLEKGTEEFNEAVAREWTKMMFRSENTAHGADRTGVFQFAGRNPVFKVFIMFQSAVSKQYSLFAEAMLKAQQGGKENLRDAAYQMTFLSISLAASKAISNAFYSLLFPPDEDEEKTWGQLLGKVAGTPLSIIPVVGNTLQGLVETLFSPTNMRKPMQIDLISSFVFGVYDTMLLAKRSLDEVSEDKIDEVTGDPKFWDTTYRTIKKAAGIAGIAYGTPLAGVIQTGELGFKLKERVTEIFNDEPKTEDFQKKVKEYEKEQRSEPVTQEYAKLFFAVTDDNQKQFNRALKDLQAKRPDIKRQDLINAIRRRPEFRVVGMVRSGKMKQKDLEANGISRDYYLTQNALLRATEEAAKTMYRDSKD